jgi:putative ATP-dependent endonuclease of OLD family
MHINRLQLTNFRGIASATITLHEGLNVLIGENKTYKTAIIDALRLCLGYSVERRDLYLQAEDFYIAPQGHQADTIEVHLTFANPSTEQQAIFIEMLTIADDGTPTLQLHVRFSRQGDRIQRAIWGGPHEEQTIPAPVLQLLYCTHLAALRDATRDLAPNRGNRLSHLFLKLIAEDDQRNQYAAAINEQIHQVACWESLLDQANTRIQAHLRGMVTKGDTSTVSVGFVDPGFKQIVEGLRIRLPLGMTPDAEAQPQEPTEALEQGATIAQAIQHFTLGQNSLGYNNLLYIATVLGDLLERTNAQPNSYAALLIEEPEAHLHPHWQNTLFGYLSGIRTRGIQVIITSHSPTITAKTPLDSLVVLHRDSAGTLTTTPVQQIGVSEPNKKHLQRFLDVTKSQLFFARSVVLVEGIAEALLLPTLARLLGDEYDLDKNAVEIVNISGVAFEPFATLFNDDTATRRLSLRCALFTDDDRDASGQPSTRAQNASNLQGGLLRVFLSHETFEFELYCNNEATVLSVYQALHPQTTFSQDPDVQVRARDFVGKLKANKDKGVFAQQLVSRLQDSTGSQPFVVPEYIRRGLQWAIMGEPQ